MGGINLYKTVQISRNRWRTATESDSYTNELAMQELGRHSRPQQGTEYIFI